MIISLIVAMDENQLIGNGDALPWRLPADLKYFKKTTMDKPILMGRKTHESIGKPLPGRTNIVLTRELTFEAEGCVVVNSIQDVWTLFDDAEELMVIGGAQLYEQLLPKANRIYLTEVHSSLAGDIFFPEFNRTDWKEISRIDHLADDRNALDYSFVVLERASPG